VSLPRDLSGNKLASLLGRFGYQITRQTGSHMRLTSALQGSQHHVTVPQHKALRVGTLHAILSDVAAYLQKTVEELKKELFG
jgi:predicted RNA binding protein YcfA (HicA-like mRNA interferase family)